MRSWVKRVHFVGIGGVGMCGIAEVLANLQYQVTGSDLQENRNTQRLRQLGVDVHIGHDAKWVADADVVVVSSAVNEKNPEVAAARQGKIPVIPRAEMLGELMRLQQGVAVAGTHGKTTTTSFIASILGQAGMDPTFVIGGRLNSAGVNARLGHGSYLVAEADESDASFIHLHPIVAVVTNIDQDHMQTYEGDFAKLKQTFIAFLHNLPFYGMAVLCLEDPVVREILPQVHKPVLTYGFSPEANVRAHDVRQDGTNMQFRVDVDGHKDWLTVSLNHPGKHNVLNALAAIAVAQVLDVDAAAIVEGLAQFGGIARRLEHLGQVQLAQGDILLIDDYAHHPREISATLEAVRLAWPQRRLVVVFQPHRYSRTHELLDDFSTVLSQQDPMLISEVYAAGETPISGADGRSLCRAIRARGIVDPVFVEDVNALPEVLTPIVRAGDVVLTMGAGSIGQVAAGLTARLQELLK